MGEIRIVSPGKTRGYPYPVCKKRIVGPGKTRGYPYPVCKNKKSAPVDRTHIFIRFLRVWCHGRAIHVSEQLSSKGSNL